MKQVVLRSWLGVGGGVGVHEKMEGWRGEGLKLEVRDRG
jgi:hypothetical protein